MSEQQQIEEILEEANAYGIRWDVKTHAQKSLKQNKSLTKLQAYQLAYAEFIKL
jgi:hypothetical protein